MLRTAWQPAFHTGSLAQYADLMDECAQHLSGVLGTAADQGVEVDIWRQLGRMTLQVVGTTAYG